MKSENAHSHFYKKIASPVGKLTLVASGDNLVAVLWPNERPQRVVIEESVASPRHPVLLAAEKQFAEYFAGKRTRFDLPLEFHGTEFQRRVWKALTKIPFGKTSSYGDVAVRAKSPLASRAVGAAVGRNPLSIVVPCHRVIGQSGKLTGFAGGLEAKAFLLKLEGSML